MKAVAQDRLLTTVWARRCGTVATCFCLAWLCAWSAVTLQLLRFGSCWTLGNGLSHVLHML